MVTGTTTEQLAHRVPAQTAAPRVDADVAEAILDGISRAFVNPIRSPILWTPDDVGLEYEDVSFPSTDGVPLEGWLMPADSDKLVILNHPMGFNRSGLPTHLEPWQSIWGPSGNTMDVNFVPDYQVLHDAGYNVLTYDLRNFGLSGSANGGAVTSGLLEARDVLGSLRFARGHADLAGMQVALFSRCLGANSTFAAMKSSPEEFAEVRCLIACQPVSDVVIMGRLLELVGVGADRLADLDRRVTIGTSVSFGRRPDASWAKYVNLPTYLYGVRGDVLTEPTDLEQMHDLIGSPDKVLAWVEGTPRRWDGYLEFQRRPQPMLDWLESHWS
jgi:pimeloyl-ACP methyl ester carboxylesterase